MAKQFLKFLAKSRYKDRLLRVIQHIYDDELDDYDIKALQGRPHHFRIRIGDVRIVILRTDDGNKIVEINNRGDLY